MRDGVGLYHSDLLVNAWGTWNYKWVGVASGVSSASEGTLEGAGIIRA